MIEFTITGIRFQMGDHLTLDERTEAAKQFVAGLEKGQQVMLMAEPENPIDPNAIAAYIDYERIGYIDKDETSEVHPLLDDNHQCDAVIERRDEHITFFISIPGATEKTSSLSSRKRVLPESPLGDNVKMPYTKTESALQLIASRLASMETNKDKIHDFISLAQRYVPLMKISICHDDCFWMNKISKKLHRVCSQHQKLDITNDELEKLIAINNKVRANLGDMHRTIDHWPERIFEDHLNRLRNDTATNQHLYKKYREAFLGGMDFAEADKELIATEHERLCGWLKNMKWSELRDHNNLQKMGLKVNYLRISRQELYELYSVLLLIEKLEEQLEGMIVNQREILKQLTPIFFGIEAEAKSFLIGIQGMKSKQITDKVNQLVTDRKISEVSRKRELWSVLNKHGLYTATDSNWNQQVK